MRILILHNFYQHHGGEDTVVQQEAEELHARGHQVKILTDKNKKGINGLLQFSLYPYNLFASKKLVKEIDLYKPDVIHIHNLHYAIGPLLIRKLKKKGYPLTMTLHNFRLICPSATLFYRGKLFTKSISENFPWTAVKKRVLDNSLLKTFITAFTYWTHKKKGTWDLIDRYFTLSDFSKDIFIKSTQVIQSNKYIVKPNFVNNPDNYNKSYNNNYIYIGRLSEEKGILSLLKAFAKTDYNLKIFGAGTQEAIVQKFANQYTNIKYLGFQNQEILHEEINSANALIVPSLCYEGMPMTIIEAFSRGTAVICSDIGILKQMVVPLYTGLHFNPASTESIISTIDIWDRLDIETKEEISRNCIQEFRQKYTKERNITLLEDTYQQIIKENEHNN